MTSLKFMPFLIELLLKIVIEKNVNCMESYLLNDLELVWIWINILTAQSHLPAGLLTCLGNHVTNWFQSVRLFTFTNSPRWFETKDSYCKATWI